ncbi:MAG: hypothetical protein CES88_04835 [Halobacteriovorax sp. JY17]|nr:MAG: hypothetical protein CES88_04835 [Halobacteriovorax sp. JY17]
MIEKMETKRKLLYIYSLSLILVISTLVIFARYVFYSEFETLEYKKIEINNEIVRKEILKDLGELSFKNIEWATRETNYLLLKNKDFSSFERNLNFSALRNQNIDLLIFGGNNLLVKGYNLASDHDESSIGLQKISPDLLKLINENKTIQSGETVLEIFNFGSFGSWLISQRPITDRYAMEASVGRLIMGKKLDSSYFNKLSSKLAIKVFYKGIESSVQSKKYKVDEFLVTDYGLELNSREFFVFSIFHSPEILLAGKSSFRLFFITSSLMIFFIMGFTYFILQRSIFSPILTLQHKVSNLDINNLQEIKVKNGDHEINELIGTINSLIVRVKSDYELLVQKSKLESLGLMAGGIAHEINNPLTILRSNSSIILRELSESNHLVDKKVSDKLKKNIKTIDRIAGIITGLQKISRHSSEDELVIVSANSVLENLKELQAGLLEDRSTRVEYKFTPNDLKFKGLEQQITQILINLVLNSAQAIDGSDDKWIRVELDQSPSDIIFRVIDSGLGINNEIQGQLMEPFFTTKSIGEGTGLGLSICRKIAHFHKGDLNLISERENTTFELTLPKLQEEEIQTA